MFSNNYGSNNNSNNTRNVTTKIKTFYGDTASLQLSYWNENLSIKINPLINVDASGLRQYDYNRRVSTAFTPEKAEAMCKKIKKKIISKIEEVEDGGTLDEVINVGVSVGTKSSAVFVKYAKDENDIPSVYLVVYTNIGEDGKAPKEGIYTYKFNKTEIMDSYDPETGEGNKVIVESEFMFFFKKLDTLSDMVATTAHSITLDNDYKNSYNNNNNSYGNNNHGGYSNNYQQSSNSSANTNSGGYSAPVSDFNESAFPFQ